MHDEQQPRGPQSGDNHGKMNRMRPSRCESASTGGGAGPGARSGAGTGAENRFGSGAATLGVGCGRVTSNMSTADFRTAVLNQLINPGLGLNQPVHMD